MKRIGAFLFMVFAAATAEARPNFVILDVAEEKNAPTRYGMSVTAKQKGDQTKFKITLSKEASSVLEKASVFFHTPIKDKPEIKIKEGKKADHVTLRFSVPNEHLKHCVLQLRSAPIPNPDTPMINFYAYRLRLDNVEPSIRQSR